MSRVDESMREILKGRHYAILATPNDRNSIHRPLRGGPGCKSEPYDSSPTLFHTYNPAYYHRYVKNARFVSERGRWNTRWGLTTMWRISIGT